MRPDWRRATLRVAAAVRRFVAIDGYDRALALAAQAFVAIVPMLIVLAAWAPDDARTGGGSWLVDALGLDGEAAAAVRLLVTRPPGAAEPVTLVGAGLLAVSVVGFARSLQRTFEAAWGLSRSGWRGLGPGLLGAAALVAAVAALVVVGSLAGPLPGGPAILVVPDAVAAALVWWPVQRLVVGGRVTWRDLLPGAVVTGAGQAVLMALSSYYLRPTISEQAQRYGVIGAAFAIVSWLVVLAVLLVAGAVIGPLVVRRDPPS